MNGEGAQCEEKQQKLINTVKCWPRRAGNTRLQRNRWFLNRAEICRKRGVEERERIGLWELKEGVCWRGREGERGEMGREGERQVSELYRRQNCLQNVDLLKKKKPFAGYNTHTHTHISCSAPCSETEEKLWDLWNVNLHREALKYINTRLTSNMQRKAE